MSAADFRAIIADREVRIREAWVKTMEVRIAREVLTECQKVEGVNHYESCKDLAARYVGLLHDAKVKGYRKIDIE
ncbi:hypothetical protein BS47DRAFT_1340336 [Hydnum rufescens UP504]|uniref:NADH-ubiquinone oxidoreductase 12 kDa subunit n=1 Tax=Hydnum rufescens UP504 TaxID=1448309 RepID=A0A9P6DZH4_9AGAM|nr:hypothetical protein BS47DRAFT_1340336 [Hydnum rufescens UP504]